MIDRKVERRREKKMNKILLHGGLAARRMALAYLTGRYFAHGVEIKALHSRLDINDVEGINAVAHSKTHEISRVALCRN